MAIPIIRDIAGLHCVKEAVEQPVGDVVFVHGLRGHPISTWKPDSIESGEYWHDWLSNDYPSLNIWTYGYQADVSVWLDRKDVTMPIFDRAGNLLECLRNEELYDRPIVFITHSLGGLIVKKALRLASDSIQSNEDNEKIIETTRGVSFIATPHTGATLASLVGSFSLLFAAAKPTVTVKELEESNPELRDLDRWYREVTGNINIKSMIFCEGMELTSADLGLPIPKKSLGFIVSKTSSDLKIMGVDAVVVDANHISIAKPENKNSLVFKSNSRFIRKLIPEVKKNFSRKQRVRF